MTTAADFRALYAEIGAETTRIGLAFEARDAKILELIARIQSGGGSMTAAEETELFGEGKTLVEGLKALGPAIPEDPTEGTGTPTPDPGTPTPDPGTGGEQP